MKRLRWYVQARLHRRLFLWFGASILATGLAAALALHLLGAGDSWRRGYGNVKTFVGGQFAETWHDPIRRDALARGIARDFDAGVTLENARGEIVSAHGNRCRNPEIVTPVRSGGEILGIAKVCFPRRERRPWTFFIVLGVAAVTLWGASGVVARRLVRPLGELVRVANAIGQGNLATRVTLRRSRVGEIGVLSDAINEMADRIERQMADQRELLAAVSHEIRSPLARLRVLAEMARDGRADPKLFDDIEREILEIDSLVGELLASSRIDFEAIQRKKLNGAEIGSRALERAGIDASRLRIDATDTSFTGDPTLIARAIQNLIDNATRHAGGPKSLVIERNGSSLSFAVEDEGPGFSEADLPKVFEKFVRGERSAGSSLGLGLALVRRIAEAHGGRAWAENRPDKGARVGFSVAD